MKTLLFITLFFIKLCAQAQTKNWTESDRQFQLQNFQRTHDGLTKETVDLTDEQWHFREAPQRWTIAEVVEHLALWEVIFARQIGIAMRSKPDPTLQQACRPDSFYRNFIMEEKSHNAPDFSKPTGFIKGKNNLAFFLDRRALIVKFVDTTKADLRFYHEPVGGGVYRNVHQVLLVQWGHIDRHLRQIRRIKEHPLFPKANPKQSSN